MRRENEMLLLPIIVAWERSSCGSVACLCRKRWGRRRPWRSGRRRDAGGAELATLVPPPAPAACPSSSRSWSAPWPDPAPQTRSVTASNTPSVAARAMYANEFQTLFLGNRNRGVERQFRHPIAPIGCNYVNELLRSWFRLFRGIEAKRVKSNNIMQMKEFRDYWGGARVSRNLPRIKASFELTTPNAIQHSKTQNVN